MQGAWVTGQNQVCVPGTSFTETSADEQRALDRGCEWIGGTCTLTDGGSGGVWSCPAGVAETFVESGTSRVLLFGIGIVVATGVGLGIAYLLTRGS